MSDISPSDRDLMIRTVLGEAEDQSDAGKSAVAHVILNRMQTGRWGSSARSVVLAPGQFEPWQTHGKELARISPDSDRYRSTAGIVDDVISGKTPDPTGGATHFLDPAVVAGRRRGTLPDWASGRPLATIGDHAFFAPDGRVAASRAAPRDGVSDDDLMRELRGAGSTAPAPSPPSSSPAAPGAVTDDELLSELRGTPAPVAPPAKAGEVLPGYDPATGMLNGVQMPRTTQGRLNFGLGVARGVKDLLDTAAHGLARGTSAAADWLASKNVLSSDTAETIRRSRDETIAADVQGRNQFDSAFADSAAATGGRFTGNVLATLPVLAAGGGTVTAGANALTRASPVAARIATAVEGGLPGRVALGAGGGAAAGSVGNALLSSASDQPLGEQMRSGALIGAPFGLAGPLVEAGARRVGGALRGAIEPFTSRGQDAIADRVIDTFAAGGPTTGNAAELVPGSRPTLAQAAGNPGLATLERAVRDVNPNPFVARETANAEARQFALNSLRGDAQSLESLKASRAAQADDNLRTAFGNAREVNTEPVLNLIDDILDSPSGKRDVVVSALQNIRGKLEGETDPAQLYGVRQAITDMLSPLSQGTASDARLASRELTSVKDLLDHVIESGAPGFKDYLRGYARTSNPIDAQQFLQGLNLTDSRGNITLARIDNALKRIEGEQRAPGPRAAKAIQSDTMDALRAIRDDLARAGNSSLGKSIGSNTFQNLATNSAVGRLAAPLALLELAHAHNPFVAAALYGGRKLYASQNQSILDRLTERMIHPQAPALSALPSAGRRDDFRLPRGVLSAAAVMGNRVIPGVPAFEERRNAY